MGMVVHRRHYICWVYSLGNKKKSKRGEGMDETLVSSSHEITGVRFCGFDAVVSACLCSAVYAWQRQGAVWVCNEMRV